MKKNETFVFDFLNVKYLLVMKISIYEFMVLSPLTESNIYLLEMDKK